MIRQYEPGDESQVLALNEACIPEVGPMDEEKLHRFAQWAPYFRVVEVDSRIVGFLVGLTEDAPYDSPNFCWFFERHKSFAYVDRVAIDEALRGAGWGPALYRDFESWARQAGRPMLCAEVNTVPPNPRSLRFHDLFGFDMVAQFEPTGSSDYRVGMMVKTF
ncbi:MAG: GNAT family N-acetyltransferase [Actinomycetia bacterium]|nr:GNAT family N-acetyltransferase [Actinomycetes bacterium]MCP5031661.1 GNAT family N-acetyltransferase [Actinomycetes bacterium]